MPRTGGFGGMGLLRNNFGFQSWPHSLLPEQTVPSSAALELAQQQPGMGKRKYELATAGHSFPPFFLLSYQQSSCLSTFFTPFPVDSSQQTVQKRAFRTCNLAENIFREMRRTVADAGSGVSVGMAI